MTLFHASRALTVRSAAIPEVAGAPALVPLKLQGREGVNSLFEYRLILQTPDAYNFKAGEGANFDLDAFIGLELTCGIELEGHGSFVPGMPGGVGANQGAGEREISGLITRARFIGESSRHALYEFTLRPWLHLATLTTDCRVYQDQSPVEIIEAVLARYAFAADRRLIETYPRRDYTVQYNESDFEFITRLMQEWGINYHFEHSGGVHRLVWSDHNGAFQAAGTGTGTNASASAYHRIPFYPLGHKIDREYIHGFSPTNALTSGSYGSRDYDYTRPRATLDAQATAPRATGHAQQAVYLWRGDRAGLGGSDYSQPNRGADKAANQTEGQGEHLARLRMQALRQSGRRATGVGHLRGIVPGCTFSLTGHPREQANIEYITLETRFVIENVGEDTQRAVQVGSAAKTAGGVTGVTTITGFTDMDGLAGLSDAQRLSGQWRVAVEFDVQPTTEALRPEAIQPKPKTGGPETARVVGPDAGTAETNIYTDALGRIKIQFPWDRHGQKNQNSSCWVRVASAWAGNQLGAMQVPRVGQEVIVDFLGGDPDLPIVTGRVYNQLNQPPWRLPEQQALSGLRSRELTPGGGNGAGGRSNHLVFDDTQGHIQAQLRSDHQHSQLSLGSLGRIEDNAGRKEARGEGFELRTDGHGVVRAKDGLLISTEGRANARAHAKDMGETVQRLAQAQDQHGRLADLAQQHRAQEEGDQAEVTESLKAQNEAIEGKAGANGQGSQQGKFPELSEPHLTLASPAGIESTTAGSTHHHSAQHHAITAGGQGYGKASFQLGTWLRTKANGVPQLVLPSTTSEEQFARALQILHDGVKFGSEDAANYLFASFDDGDPLVRRFIDPIRARRYKTLADALWHNPDLRFPNLDRVLPLPPAKLPQWDSNPDTLIDAAKAVRVTPKPQKLSGHAYPPDHRAHIPPGQTLQVPPHLSYMPELPGFTSILSEAPGATGMARARTTGYWQPRPLPARDTDSVSLARLRRDFANRPPLRFSEGERMRLDVGHTNIPHEDTAHYFVTWHFMGWPVAQRVPQDWRARVACESGFDTPVTG